MLWPYVHEYYCNIFFNLLSETYPNSRNRSFVPFVISINFAYLFTIITSYCSYMHVCLFSDYMHLDKSNVALSSDSPKVGEFFMACRHQ